MKTYLIREIPDDTWRAFKSKLASEGISIREWMLKRIMEYITPA